MIRRSPSERYIQYLLLHPKKYSNDEVRQILDFAQLDFLGNWYLDKLRAQLHPPFPFRPFERAHQPSYKFLLAEGLWRIFLPDTHGKRAFEILKRPRVKEFVEAMLTAGAPPLAIADGISQRLSFPCKLTDVIRYADFFWDVTLLDSTELRASLQFRVDRLETHPDPEIRAQAKSVRNAFYKDARRTAADLPFSPHSAMITQIRMGVMPSRLDLAKALEQTRYLAVSRTLEAVASNGKGDSSRAFDYATVLDKLTVVMKEVVRPDDELHGQLATIAMRSDEAKIPSVHTLSLGNHTAEVVVMGSKDGVPADFDPEEGSDDVAGEPG